MAYTPPSIGSAGLTIPTYADILANLLAQFQLIYGQTVYLAADSADYQWISAISLKFADVMQAVQLAYNARSPLTAVGSDLDAIVKLNGLIRKPATFSSAVITVVGTAGAVIPAGVMADVNGYYWDLPSNTTIPGGGSIAVTATCETPGIVTANPGDIAIIKTPTAGWTSGVNASAAIAGQSIESDSQLRARQSISAGLPSITPLAGTIAAIAATTGVTRYNIIENPTGTTDALGTPAHSITAVVEGGTNLAVGTAIYNRRGIGCLTNGTTSVTVTDPVSGTQMSISFIRPTYYAAYVSISVHPLTGYTSATATAIQAAVAAYLNSLQIGQSIVVSELYGAALSVRPNPQLPLFSIRALTVGASPSPSGTSDIALAYTQVAQGITAQVVITSV